MRFSILTISLLVAAAPVAAQQYAPTPVQLPDRALGGKLNVPSGVKVATFATVARPRFMALGPDGAVYVSQPSSNQVTRLVDADGDGTAESQTVAVSGLDRPHGLAFHDGWLYVANTGAVVRVRLGANGTASGQPEQVATYSSGGGHWTRTVVFGPDGAMYVAIGSSCNICDEKDDDRAAVVRFDANGKNRHVFSKGLRNAVGMAVEPTSRQIWVTQNERDNLKPEHENLPPEEINILRDGADYGWPACHSDRVPNPEYNDPQRCANTVPPALPMQAHSAPLGIAFLAGATKLPADLRGDALVAFHGSWNRDQPTGAKVVRVRVTDGKPVGYEDFITGWQGSDGRRWGRPVDVLVAKDGSVLISDDQAGAIYRVWQ
jgi:glucose/arabinose dehydrogenase